MNAGPYVIFDMDGVLVDSEPLYRRMNLEFISSRGGDTADVDYDRYVGSHAWDMWADLKARFALPEAVGELVAMEMTSKNRILRSEALRPIPGALELIGALLESGSRLAVASSSRRVNVDLVLGRLGIAPYFEHVVCGEDVVRGKPAPDIFLLAALKLGAAPAACTVIEDSANGIAAAKSAGMRAIGYRTPASGRQDLGSADLIVDSLGEIRMATFRS